MANITRSGKHNRPFFLEKDHLGKDIGEGSKPTEPKEKEEEDRVLTQLKKTQAHVLVWGMLIASHKHRKCFLGCFQWERGAYRNYTIRSTISHGS